MPTFAALLDRTLDALTSKRFDPRLVSGLAIDTGEMATRARSVAARLNAVRPTDPKEPVVVWMPKFSAITRRGPWIYISKALAEKLSDDGLAFVLAHEMAHHDLRHLSPTLVAAAWIGESQRMELHADAEGLRIAHAAGFSPEGALEALSPSLWNDEPQVVETPGPLDRFRRTHPHPAERTRALREAMSTLDL